MRSLREFIEDRRGSLPKTIIMMLVVVLIFSALFGTIAYNLENLTENASVEAIPGGTTIIPIISLLGIIVVLMYFIRKAF